MIKVLKHGCGAFLRPPAHPEHFCCIEVDGVKLSLSGALFNENVAVRIIAKKLLEWDTGEIDSDWVYRVLGYYAHAWRNPKLKEPECWFHSNIFYCEDAIGASYLDHFGVHFIQKFYPEYFPTQEDFDNAYWDGVTSFGSQPVDIPKSVQYNEIKFIGYDPSARLPAAIQSTITDVIRSGGAFNLP